MTKYRLQLLSLFCDLIIEQINQLLQSWYGAYCVYLTDESLGGKALYEMGI